jgi:P-type Cu+ transporter
MTFAPDSTADVRSDSSTERRRARERREAERLAAKRQSFVLLIGCAALCAPMVLPLVGYVIGLPLHLNAWIEFVLATPVQLLFGVAVYRRAWQALKSLSGNMELLISLGSSAAYGVSAYWVLRAGVEATGHVYFEEATAAITLVMFGYWLEPSVGTGVSPSRQLVDRVCGLFIVPVIAIALATFLSWRAGGSGLADAVVAALSVLIMACPCALGLAAPAALAAARAAAGRVGLLIHDSDAFERAAGVDTVVFDKPGTLSEGRLAVTAMELAPTVDEQRLLRFAATMQVMSGDPVAHAIVAAMPSGVRLPRVGSIRIDRGRGVAATVEGREVVVGNRDMMRQGRIDLGRLEPALNRFERAAKTTVIVAVDGHALGMLAVADPLRAHAAAAITMLAVQNVRSEMLTADSELVASSIAVELGIGSFKAMVKSADAPAAVRALEAQGRRVAVVGDGTNEPPVLGAAQIGLAFSRGSTDPMAGVGLMRCDPRLVPATIDLARRAIVAVRRNLVLALLYNAAGIPFATLGLLTPARAAAAMGLSFLSVTVHSLWLTAWRPKYRASRRSRHPKDVKL